MVPVPLKSKESGIHQGHSFFAKAQKDKKPLLILWAGRIGPPKRLWAYFFKTSSQELGHFLLTTDEHRFVQMKADGGELYSGGQRAGIFEEALAWGRE